MSIVETFRAEFLRYKTLGEKAIAQIDEHHLTATPGGTGNSIAVICWHISGNLRSRFTDFLTSDGEKPWRKRDEEFESRSVSRAELLAKWEDGWTALLGALDGLSDSHLQQRITIRKESLTVIEALARSLAHTASHVGQILYAGKAIRGDQWNYLSIAPGKSEEFNKNPSGR